MSLKSLEDRDKEYRKKLEKKLEREIDNLKKARDKEVDEFRKMKDILIDREKNKANKKQMRSAKEIVVEKIRNTSSQIINDLRKQYKIEANRNINVIDDMHMYMNQEFWQTFWNKYWSIVSARKIRYEFFNSKKWLDVFRRRLDLSSFGILTNYHDYTGDEVISFRISNDKYNGFILKLQVNDKDVINVNYNNSNTRIDYNPPLIEREYVNYRIKYFTAHQEEIIPKIDNLCRYAYNYYNLLYNTTYLQHLPAARAFYICSRKTFPKDISKIIYKKILFFVSNKKLKKKKGTK